MSKETPAYEEWKVHPVKSEAIVKKFKEIIEELKGATTAEEAIKAMKAYEKYGDKITDNFATIALNYTLDTRDKKNIKNQEAIDRAMPEVQAATLPYAEAVLSSPFRAEIEKKFGSLYLTMLEYQVKSFSPAEAIIELAKLNHCDLILMASHGRKGIAAVLLGSETQKVLTHSQIPVMVYR